MATKTQQLQKIIDDAKLPIRLDVQWTPMGYWQLDTGVALCNASQHDKFEYARQRVLNYISNMKYRIEKIPPTAYDERELKALYREALLEHFGQASVVVMRLTAELLRRREEERME